VALLTPFSTLPIKSTTLKYLFVLLVSLYTVLLVINPALGPSDEFAFLATLQSGAFFPMYGADFPYYNSVEIGRFSPLGGQEYNLVALFTNSPVGYFSLNAIELLLCAVLLIWLLRRYSIEPALAYLAGILLLLTPGLVLAYFKLLAIEKNVLLLFLGFLGVYHLFQQRQKAVHFAITLLFANAAIYYKEAAFSAIANLAAAHLILTWKTSTNRSRALDGLLIASAMLYLGIYLVTILPYTKGAYLPSAEDYNFFIRAKNIANYALSSDPIPIFILVPLLLWRLYQVYVRKMPAHPMLDPMLAAGAAYIGVFLVLNMYLPYYFLPAYAFILPPAIYFLGNSEMRGVYWKATFALVAVVMLLNAAPLAIHFISYNKYVPINFNKTMDFLVEDINRRYAGERLNIFYYGTDREAGGATYFIAGEYLKFKGLSIRKFDFKSDREAQAPVPIGNTHRYPLDKEEDIRAVDPNGEYVNPGIPFSVFQPGPAQRIQRGDYLVLSPQSTAYFDQDTIERIKKEFDLVFYTNSTFSIPRVDLKAFVKSYLYLRRSSESRARNLIKNENIWNWPDYYVFVKR